MSYLCLPALVNIVSALAFMERRLVKNHSSILPSAACVDCAEFLLRRHRSRRASPNLPFLSCFAGKLSESSAEILTYLYVVRFSFRIDSYEKYREGKEGLQRGTTRRAKRVL